MITEHIRIIYDGPAVSEGEMEVGQLASSLLALGKLIENADAARTGEPGRVKVRIRADVARGSFDIGIAVHWAEGVAQAAIAWAGTPQHASTLAILGFLGVNARDVTLLGGRGVLQAVRWLRGRRVTRQVSVSDGNVTLITEDGDQLSLNALVAKLAVDPAIRQPLERFTEPLREEGVQEIRIEPEQGVLAEIISAEEAPAFAADATGDPTSSDTFKATYQIKRLFFDRGRKWRLSNGAQTIQAEIEDEDFWRRIEASQEAFAKEDYLVCVVRMDQWLSASGLRTEHRVVKIEEHLSSPHQSELPNV